jgi:hypothetical protein
LLVPHDRIKCHVPDFATGGLARRGARGRRHRDPIRP